MDIKPFLIEEGLYMELGNPDLLIKPFYYQLGEPLNFLLGIKY